jgi:hypothetical protein
MNTALRIVDQLISALSNERLAQANRFSTMLTHSSPRERAASGVAWYPVRIRERGYGFGDYPFVVLERTSEPRPHQLTGGKPCQIFSRTATEERTVDGTLHWVNGGLAHVILRVNDHPDWLDDGRIGVQITFDASGYADMSDALARLRAADGDRTAELRDCIYGDLVPSFDTVNHAVAAPHLNTSQQRAVQAALAAHQLAVVHGPPGTGKTTTVVEIIRQLANREKPVLVCAPSNAAVDVLVERCAAAGLDVLRLGNLARVDAGVVQHTLDERWKSHPLASTIKEMKKRADEFRRMASKYKRTFGRDEATQRKLLLAEARSIVTEARALEDQISTMLVDAADVIACTPVTARNREISNRRFAAAVVDEAGQALDPALWIPLQCANKLILAGDHLQLPPTIISQSPDAARLATTMLEHVVAKHPSAVNLLTEQYRMNDRIMGFSNSMLYGDAITSHPDVEHHVFPSDSPPEASISFLDTSGRGWEEQPGEGDESLANTGETSAVQHVLTELSSSVEATSASVGIISPYRGQVRLLEQAIDATLRSHFASCDINTVDSFQGSECDIIVVSLVRSNPDGVIGFLSDTRRMNVAMTRARKRLVMIGDGSTISRHPFYQALLEYVERRGTYISVWSLGL